MPAPPIAMSLEKRFAADSRGSSDVEELQALCEPGTCLQPARHPTEATHRHCHCSASLGSNPSTSQRDWFSFRILGPVIDKFRCWTAAGSALCFEKEDCQPTPQLVCVSGYVVRSTIGCRVVLVQECP